ncbi:ABC transporter ATP-binding protein [Arthrobacter sp. Br18]|uniref:ABC transporter ATP-binding protein n=1 Tax=Arthrobacter sp. Br18 TaxID=1312954 RepID=UPI0004B690EF|nr:ABC transporter ATP-binding protein [Arthrobacter sp. Br18]
MQPSSERARLTEFWPYLRGHIRVLIAAAVVSLFATGLSVVQPLMVQQLVNAVSGGEPAVRFVWLLVAITLAGAIFSAAQSYLLQRTAESVVLGLRRSLIGHLLGLPIREFDKRRVGDLMSRVGSDTTLMRSVITSGLFDIVSSVLMFAAAVVLMILLDPLLFGITLGAVLLGTGGVLMLGSLIRKRSKDVQDAVGAMSAAVERGLSGIRTIKASVAEQREAAVIDTEAVTAFRAGIAMAKLQAAVQPIMSICIQGAFIVVLAVGGLRGASGALQLGDLLAFILYLFLLVLPIGSAMSAFVQIQSGLAALDRIQEIARLEPENADEHDGGVRTRSGPDAVVGRGGTGRAHGIAGTAGDKNVSTREATTGPARVTGAGQTVTGARRAMPTAIGTATGTGTAVGTGTAPSMELRNVRFRYDRDQPEEARPDPAADDAATSDATAGSSAPDDPPWVLDDVSFTVPAGSRTALVGPSGAGKSTVLALLERFYEPSSGSIHFDGVPISSVPRAELRQRMGLVEQEAPVLSGTLADNLRLAAPSASDQELAAALDAVGLTELINRSAEGLQLNLGEDGVRLSGGQRQRLAWARIILADRPVLLLDEPTSSVDSRTEQLLQQTLGRAARNRTVVVVAHRLSTIADFDQILVLEGGRLVASGTHTELLAGNELYRDMAARQRLTADVRAS